MEKIIVDKSNTSLQDIINLIDSHSNFLITSHVSPDGDSLGSTLAMYLFLKQLGKEAKMLIDDQLPSCFSFLDKLEDIKVYEEGHDYSFDLAFVLDCSSFERVGALEKIISTDKIINIDHHGDNPYYGKYNLVRKAAATGEIVYQLIKEFAHDINVDIATALATALITDTGSFRYSNTTAETHRIMGELLEIGVNTSRIAKDVFDTHSYQNLILRGKALSNLNVDNSGKISWIKISRKFLEENNSSIEDTEGLIDYPRSLEGVEVAVLFKEIKKDLIKVSLRSNSYFSVDKLAHKFGGGGHVRAAGLTFKGSLLEAENQVIETIKKELREN